MVTALVILLVSRIVDRPNHPDSACHFAPVDPFGAVVYSGTAFEVLLGSEPSVSVSRLASLNLGAYLWTIKRGDESMHVLSVLGNPPTVAEIKSRRVAAGSGRDAGFMAFMICPIPIVDLAVGAAAKVIDESLYGRERDAIKTVSGAISRDWSTTQATQTYVEKVREQGRDLIAEEVSALDDYVRHQTLLTNGASALFTDLKGALGFPVKM